MNLFLLLSMFTVTIHIQKDFKTPTGRTEHGMATCTGVFITSNEILTAGHCLEHSRGHQWIRTNDNKSFEAEIVKIDTYHDLALLRIPKITFHVHAVMGKDAYTSEEVYTVNSGNELIGTFNKGMVANVIQVDDDLPVLIMSTIQIYHGASGSGLFDWKGKLVGINVMTDKQFSLSVNTKDIVAFLALAHAA